MKKVIITVFLAVVLLVTLGGAALAETGKETGNGSLSGPHYNLNIIGSPNQKNANFDGGNGSRIFVKRNGQTKIYVGAGNSYQILDHDGTDGEIGSGGSTGKPSGTSYEPGIIFPTTGSGETTVWRVKIYARLLGPVDSKLNWKSYYFDTGGDAWVKWFDEVLEKDSKFTLRTGDFLKDGYEDILWELDPVNKFRIIQLRIYLEEI